MSPASSCSCVNFSLGISEHPLQSHRDERNLADTGYCLINTREGGTDTRDECKEERVRVLSVAASRVEADRPAFGLFDAAGMGPVRPQSGFFYLKLVTATRLT